MKFRLGQEVIENRDGQEMPQHIETAKRAVAFAYWARAISNSIPENELQPYMATHLGWLDAIASKNQREIAKADEGMKRWIKWG